MSAKAIYLWGEGDARFDATFMTTMYNYNGTWGTSGYYAYYNGSNLGTMPIAFRYFPFYVTEAEAEAEFAANPSRYQRGDNVNAVYAYIMSDPVVRYSFRADGTWTKDNPSYSECCSGLNFPATVKKFDDPETAQENTAAKAAAIRNIFINLFIDQNPHIVRTESLFPHGLE